MPRCRVKHDMSAPVHASDGWIASKSTQEMSSLSESRRSKVHVGKEANEKEEHTSFAQAQHNGFGKAEAAVPAAATCSSFDLLPKVCFLLTDLMHSGPLPRS